jgi:hypothetical protein
MRLTGQKTNKKLITHVNHPSLANCETKSRAYFERDLEFFAVFQNVYVFIPQFLAEPWDPMILWNPEWETLIQCVQKVLTLLTLSSASSSLTLQPSKCFLHDKYALSSVQSSISLSFYTHMPQVQFNIIHPP